MFSRMRERTKNQRQKKPFELWKVRMISHNFCGCFVAAAVATTKTTPWVPLRNIRWIDFYFCCLKKCRQFWLPVDRPPLPPPQLRPPPNLLFVCFQLMQVSISILIFILRCWRSSLCTTDATSNKRLKLKTQQLLHWRPTPLPQKCAALPTGTSIKAVGETRAPSSPAQMKREKEKRYCWRRKTGRTRTTVGDK